MWIDPSFLQRGLEENEMVKLMSPEKKSKEGTEVIFQFLQNMCEGHYIEMKVGGGGGGKRER